VTPSRPTWSLRSESDKLLVHFAQPPKSANLCLGPYAWHDLQRIFALDDDTIAALQRLESDQRLRMRVQFLSNVAFIYDPIFGQSGEISFLIDWGDKESNDMIVNHVTEDGSDFHTFVFPINKDQWYYLGALTWKPADSKKWAVWPRLRRKARAELLRKLKVRSGADERVEERMGSGEAEQIIFEISGHGHDQRSQEFATTLRNSAN